MGQYSEGNGGTWYSGGGLPFEEELHISVRSSISRARRFGRLAYLTTLFAAIRLSRCHNPRDYPPGSVRILKSCL